MIKRFLGIGAGAVALALVSGLIAASSALAQTPTPTATPTATPDAQVVTQAEVTGAGAVAPVIECKWELPDMQVGTSDSTFPDSAVQYGTLTDADVHDDDMAVGPSTSPACYLPADSDPPTMLDGVQHMIQVVPVPEDDPEERHIQLWMAVDHPNGISNIGGVYWDVYHPNGDLKIELVNIPDEAEVVHQVTTDDCNSLSGGLGGSDDVGKMFEAAVHTGQVSAAAVDDDNRGLLALCSQGLKAIYYSSFDLSKHQPCGEYMIKATAASGGEFDTLTNYIDVECVFYLRIDFTTVNWGAVTPGNESIVGGDRDFTTANHPTVKNVGNSGMGLGLRFGLMTGVADDSKTINQFDAKFGRTADVLQVIKPMWAGTYYEFDDTLDRVLCSNDIGKLDLSIEPPSLLPKDVYTGTLDVIGRHVAGVCEGEY